jgi:pimeloyl-ACP methyl ester carboxylesterase
MAFVLVVTMAAVVVDLVTSGGEPAVKLYAGPYTRVDGTLAAYQRWGTHGSPIVLLGGAAEPSWVWHAVGPLLAASGHRAYALDLPPFGYTQRHGPYTLAGWVALLEGFEHNLRLVRPLVVGHSLGAGVAAADALAHPTETGGIVLLDGDALPVGHGVGWLTDLLVYPYATAVYRLATQSDWLVSRILRNAWGPQTPRLNHQTLQQFERPFRVAGTEDALKQLVSDGIPGLTLGSLQRIRVPRTVVWGAQDTVDPLANGERTAAALGVKLQLIPNTGHLSMLAQPRAVAEAIVRLIGTKSAATESLGVRAPISVDTKTKSIRYGSAA